MGRAKGTTMYHASRSEATESIAKQGLISDSVKNHTSAGVWADEIYQEQTGFKPIYVSVEPGKYDGTIWSVQAEELYPDLPTLVDHGACLDEGGVYWEEDTGTEVDEFLDEGFITFEVMFENPQPFIELTGTAAICADQLQAVRHDG